MEFYDYIPFLSLKKRASPCEKTISSGKNDRIRKKTVPVGKKAITSDRNLTHQEEMADSVRAVEYLTLF
jgi:hypothetical protein